MLRDRILANIQESLEEKGVKINKTQLQTVFLTVFEEVGKAVLDGAKITTPIGNFKLTESKERAGHNPRTGEKITIAARKRVTLSTSKNFNVLA